MQLSARELSEIAEGASSLGERLAGGHTAAAGDDPAAARRLARWRHLAGEDQPRQLAAMLYPLGKEGMPDSDLLSLLGPVRRGTDIPLPEWTRWLNEIVAWVGQSFRNVSPHPAQGNGGIPYEHLYWPVAAYAWEQVVSQHPHAVPLLGEKARHELQRYLVRRIAGIASTALHPLFLAHKSFATSGMMQLLFNAKGLGEAGGNAARHYAGFVAEQGQEGLRPLFTRFPVAARLIATVTWFWINFVGEFLHRLHTDQSELENLFGVRAVCGGVRSVKVGISDPHDGGRSVLILGFHNDLRLVYKPRPVGIDRAFYRLVEKINARIPDPGLGILKVLHRGDYGWVEFARHVPCSDRRAAKRYYRRAGFLAYLAHWLQGIDFHRENVVAAGEYPMLVDLECLAHPLRPDEISLVEGGSTSVLPHSVLRTGLLPMWQSRMAGGALYDNCGLNGPVSRQSFVPVLRWERSNTDAMGWLYKSWSHHHGNHRPVLNGRLLSITPFESDVLTGYREMAALLEGAGSASLRPFRDEIYEAAARRIKRPTLIYGLLLRSSLDPAVLSEGVDRSIELMALPCAVDDPDWNEEVSSLEMLDVPYFRYSEKTKFAPSSTQSVQLSGRALYQENTVKSAIRRRVRLEGGKIAVDVQTGRPRARQHVRTITPGP